MFKEICKIIEKKLNKKFKGKCTVCYFPQYDKLQIQLRHPAHQTFTYLLTDTWHFLIEPSGIEYVIGGFTIAYNKMLNSMFYR